MSLATSKGTRRDDFDDPVPDFEAAFYDGPLEP
jgi:hypothetical protein